MPGSILPPTVGTSSSGEKSDSLLPGVEYTRCMHCSLYTRFNVENAGGDFSVGGARLCFRIPENPCSPRPVVAERANPLPPVADSGMKEIRTKKKKHMTKDVNGMKKRRGRPALGKMCIRDRCGTGYSWSRRKRPVPGSVLKLSLPPPWMRFPDGRSPVCAPVPFSTGPFSHPCLLYTSRCV